MTKPLGPIGSIKQCEALAELIYPGGKLKKEDKCCGVCGARDVKLWTCSGCNIFLSKMNANILYCSRKCQHSDWKTHKWYCQPLGTTYKTYSVNGLDISKRLHDHVIPTASNFPVKNWAVYQAFLANPHHNPRTTCLEITMKPVKLGDIVFPDLPIAYEFRPLKPEEAKVYWHNQPLEENQYGYWHTKDQDVAPVQNSSLSEFMFLKVDHWPYILAKTLAANQGTVPKAVGYWLYLFQSVIGQSSIDGEVLRDYTGPKIEKKWQMDMGTFYNWMTLTRNIMPS